jgi:putative ABC transport system ATP-binding protein
MTIQLAGITRRFGQRAVLDNVSQDVARGQFVAVVGPSGSGKSTLLNCLAAIDQPDSGSISVNGIDLGSLNETKRARYRRQTIGMVFQHSNLLPSLTVLENVLLRWSLDRRITAADRQAAAIALGRVDMAEAQHRFPDTLSGGEQQRVAIAAALIHQPSVLIADEPTGALDADRADTIMDLLVELVREQDTTLLVATHANDIAAQADYQWTLRGGQVTVHEQISHA